MDSRAELFEEREGYSLEAYSLYSQAREEWSSRTPEARRRGSRLQERAIALDGTFALACAALADCYSILMDYGVLSPREGLTAARLAAGRALHRGPELAESLTAAALVRQMDLDWPSAEAEFQAAIRAHPGYASARQRYALFLAWTGRLTEAAEELTRARELDPESPVVAASQAWVEYYRRRFPEAATLARAVVREHPDLTTAAAVLALALIQQAQTAEAMGVLERALASEPGNVSLMAFLAFAQAAAGREREARGGLARLLGWSSQRYVSPYYLAVPGLALGNPDRAMTFLRRAETERSPQLAYLGVEPLFDPLRGREEFGALLARIGIPSLGSLDTRAVRASASQTAGEVS